MSSTATSSFKLIRKVKSEDFNSRNLQTYTLSLLIGTRDFQFCATESNSNKCLYVEDYKFGPIKTINARLETLKAIFNNHPLLHSFKWGTIKLVFKTNKSTLVPNSFFIPEASSDYLVLNSQLHTKIEDVYFYKHISHPANNIFAVDKKVLRWIKQVYPKKSLQVIHQGSAIIEGVLRYDDHSHEKTMFLFVDRGYIHVIVTQNKSLLFYNQFVLKEADDFVKYVMLIFKELKLDPKTNKLVIWGMVKNDSSQITAVKKYVRNISFGDQPKFLKFPTEFDDLASHRYFDLYSIFLCE